MLTGALGVQMKKGDDMRTSRLIAIAVLPLFGLMANAKASPITYTESATVSGSLNGVSFTNELLTLTGTGDTANVVTNGNPYNVLTTATFTLAGSGSGTFTVGLDVFDNPSALSGTAGFQRATQSSDLLDTVNAAFVSYGLTTSIGPITGSPLFNPGLSFSTTAGPLILDSASAAAFTANAGTVSAVPLPAALPLFATGLGALGLLGWRRKRKAAALAA
jgi:hypothetical protein